MDNKGLHLKYFILNPTSKDEAHRDASIAAMRTYALHIGKSNPVMSKEINEWMDRISNVRSE